MSSLIYKNKLYLSLAQPSFTNSTTSKLFSNIHYWCKVATLRKRFKFNSFLEAFFPMVRLGQKLTFKSGWSCCLEYNCYLKQMLPTEQLLIKKTSVFLKKDPSFMRTCVQNYQWNAFKISQQNNLTLKFPLNSQSKTKARLDYETYVNYANMF